MKVSYSYLSEQFTDPDPILNDIKSLIRSGEFTLGKHLEEFEQNFATLCHTKFAIGVASGTDALRLSLIAFGIGVGDEVITTPSTFFATIGAIVTVGARPVYVDVKEDYTLDPDLIEKTITPKTKAILPVHWHGCPAEMEKISQLARKHNLTVIEDACMAIGAEINGKRTGSFGDAGCFSLHPLKPINVWGDGGVITTNSEQLRDKLLLLRNHGLKNRDECLFYAYNSRLDPLQAIVGLHLMKEVDWIINRKIHHANRYDQALAKISEITIPPRTPGVKHVYHNYVIMAERRDELYRYLREREIDCKIHYPLPQHLQQASQYLGYQTGDFMVAEEQARKIISLPVHQHLTPEQIEYVIETITTFYHYILP